MTNAQIILAEQIRLADEGILKYTGRILETVLADGTTTEIKEIQPIHTFQAWKKLGYKVKKGEKAIARFPIWKYTTKKSESEDGEEEKINSRMFMKVSAFFTDEQVEKMEVK